MRTHTLVLLAASVLLLSGCVEKGPLLIEGVTYRAPEGTIAGTAKVVIGVGPFKDERGTKASLIGKRTTENNYENDLVVQGTAADIVTAGVKEALKARGIAVRDVPSADPAAATFNPEGANIVIGGEIKAFWADAVTRPLNARTAAEVRIRVSVADAAEKKVFRTLVLSSKVEREDISFSFDRVAGALAEALSASIDQLLKDDEFKKHIQ